jgi:hypothetical protein
VELLYYLEAWRGACLEWSCSKTSEDVEMSIPYLIAAQARLAGLCFADTSFYL